MIVVKMDARQVGSDRFVKIRPLMPNAMARPVSRSARKAVEFHAKFHWILMKLLVAHKLNAKSLAKIY